MAHVFGCVFEGRITHVKHWAYNACLVNASYWQIPPYQSNWSTHFVAKIPVSLLTLAMPFLSPEIYPLEMPISFNAYLASFIPKLN